MKAWHCIALAYGLYLIFITAAMVTDAREKQRASECPPYDQCTPHAKWNAPNCRCWDGH